MLERPRRRLEGIIKMDDREMRLGDMDWINLTYDRHEWRAVGNIVMNLRVP
jgi:hypothetical protein